jgi:hypothetical protein
MKLKLSDGYEDIARYAHTIYNYPITYNKREFNITKKLNFFFKWSLNHENEVKDI